MQNGTLNQALSPQDWHRQLEGLGHVTGLLQQCRSLSGRSLAYLSKVIWPALRTGRIQFYFDADGKRAAYAVWAYLPPESEELLLSREPVELEALALGDGGSLWLIDLVAPRGHVRYVLDDLRDRLFSAQNSVRYFRIKNGRRIVKEVERDRRRSFFKTRSDNAWRCGQQECPFCRPCWPSGVA